MTAAPPSEDEHRAVALTVWFRTPVLGVLLTVFLGPVFLWLALPDQLSFFLSIALAFAVFSWLLSWLVFMLCKPLIHHAVAKYDNNAGIALAFGAICGVFFGLSVGFALYGPKSALGAGFAGAAVGTFMGLFYSKALRWKVSKRPAS